MALVGTDKTSCLNCRLPLAQFDKEYQKQRKYYERLKKSDEFCSVDFDEKLGGVLAIHKGHNYDQNIGKYGIPRGEYEMYAAKFLQKRGYRVLMQNEQLGNGVKAADLLLDGIRADIKSIEETGKYTVVNAFKRAEAQKCSTVIIYIHNTETFSTDYIDSQWDKFIQLKEINGLSGDTPTNTILVISSNKILYYQKSD